jgi:hypothetical protein
MTPLTYRDATGVLHEMVVRKTPAGDWEVLDTGAGNGDRESRRACRRRASSRGGRPRLRDRQPLYTPGGGATGARPYLSSEEQMSTAIAHRPQRVHRTLEVLRCRVRLADGRVFAGELTPERHRSLQIGLLHRETEGLVELAAGMRYDGRLQITTRRRADHFLPGGRAGADEWRQTLLELAARHADRGEEVFLAPAARSRRAATSTPSARATGCGSTSTSPASCTPYGRSWPSGRATC